MSLYRSPDNIMILKQISKGDNHYLKKQQPSWMEGEAVGHNFERDTPRDHLCQVWTLHRCFRPSLAPFGQAVSEEKIFLTLANQKKELILVAKLLAECNQMKKLFRESYIDASCLVWLHFPKQFQRRRFFKQ